MLADADHYYASLTNCCTLLTRYRSLLQSAPSAAEALHQNFKQKKGKLTEKTKASVMDRYGNAAEAAPDSELLMGQTERCDSSTGIYIPDGLE